MASLQHHAALLLTVGLFAGCGGDRSRAGAGTDTSGVAPAAPDSSAAMPADTGAQSARDTTSPTATSGAADTAARSNAAAPAAPGTKPSARSDTAGKHAMKSAAKKATAARSAAPAPTAQQQDTSKAAAGAAQGQSLRDAYHQPPKDTVSQAVYDGWKQFNLNCARCHGEDALGTTIAPHLIMSLKPNGPINTKELFVQTVCAGRPAKGMPSWCALGLSMDKINDIYLYVKGRSDAKISPGRPAVKPEG